MAGRGGGAATAPYAYYMRIRRLLDGWSNACDTIGETISALRAGPNPNQRRKCRVSRDTQPN